MMNGSEDQVKVEIEAASRRRVRKEGVQASQSSSVGNMVGNKSLEVFTAMSEVTLKQCGEKYKVLLLL